jgi:predicted MFS family arabinose efflux permease
MNVKQVARRVFGFDYADDQPLPAEKRRGLTWFYWDAVFSLFSDASSQNYVNLFLVSLKATNTQIGLLATMTQILTALAPLLGAAMSERSGRYRAHVIVPALIARLGWFPLAILPFLPLGPTAVGAAIALFGLKAFLLGWLTAPWTAFVGRLVPMGIRANYFAMRNFGGGVATIFGTLLAGQIIGGLGTPVGFQLVFLISGIAGVLAVWMFARVPFGGAAGADSPTRPRASLQHSLIGLRQQPAFFRYLICNCALALAVGIGGPFIQVYQVRDLGFSAGVIGLLASVELLVNIVMQRVYGKLIMPRFGQFRVMRALRFATALVPLLWLFADSPWWGLPVVMLAGSIWSGHELANFNGLLNVTPEQGQANYIALHTFAVSLCAAVGPAIGGAVVDQVGFFPLFAASGGLRLGAAILLALLIRRMPGM